MSNLLFDIGFSLMFLGSTVLYITQTEPFPIIMVVSLMVGFLFLYSAILDRSNE